ncbi:MAG: dihydropteroate synthase [Burkholderiales bacterium]|nr:dihydropteroate synthase [Burkholderiales bacterium]
MILHCGKYRLVLDRPLIMGVVNVTPDSFSDGGRFLRTAAAVAHARRLVDEGADLLDVGGESTRPGAAPVALDEERRRVLPVIEALSGAGVPLSVDTQKPELMREAAAAGAALVNDVNGFEAPGALEAVAGGDCAVCIMHRQGDPRTMQQSPQYADVVAEVAAYLRLRSAAAQQAGIAPGRIVVDPGFGFGKKRAHNMALLHELGALAEIGCAICVGASRKFTPKDATDEMKVAGSLVAGMVAARNGAQILRVHDVAPHKGALGLLPEQAEASA